MPPYINISEILKVASAFYLAFAREKFKHFFLISNVTAGNILPANYELSGQLLEYVSTICDHFCLEIHYT